MDMRAKTCCFTGHRSLSGAEKLKVAVRLRKAIKELVKQGVVFYGAGGALGFDTLAAQTVLDMKKEYPQLRLILVLPCEDQTRGWRSEDIAVYEDIKRRSDTYAAETAETITRECNAYGIHEDADLAEAYALYRNDTAHGTLKRPEPIDVVTYSILRYFVYAMNLKKANIPPERIADIIRKVF